MKNCVFIPIFDAVKLDSFFLLLESIGIYSNIKNDTEVLIYTNSEIKPAIEKSQLFAADSMRVVTGAREGATAPAVYDYFLVAPAPAAENILYLDTEVLIKKDIKPIFDILSEAGKEFLYVGGGGDKIMLFYNCPQTVELFDKLKETPELPAGSLNAEELQRYITPEIDCDFSNDKIFLTTTSQKEALSQLIEKSIAKNIEYTKYYIDNILMPIIREIDEPLEGNIFFFHECITKYCDDF